MRQRITFENFLGGRPVRDYTKGTGSIAERTEKAAELLREADYVLLGAGAGMSTAAGAQYGGQFFQDHFADFIRKYGDNPYMRDMYSAGFYPYPSERAFWGYWCQEAKYAGYELDVTPLHKTLLNALAGKEIFLLSTNADAQFEKAGLSPEQIFCTQGDYFHIQCARGCHSKTYEATDLFRRMDAGLKDCCVPLEMVPRCPVCGGRMSMNLRADSYFVEDADWHAAERRFGDFLSCALASGKKVCLLELGVGYNTPGIIRYPFDRLLRDGKNTSLIRLNLDDAEVPAGFSDRAVGIEADMAQSITDLAALLAEKRPKK